jgi:hypothetical protein
MKDLNSGNHRAAEPLVLALLSRLFIGIFFDPGDGGDMLLWNIGWLSTDYTHMLK